jgi:hypothetical protein
MRGSLIQGRRRLAAGVALAVGISLGIAAAWAHPDQLDDKMTEEVPKVLKALRAHGYHNVGVLRFRVQQGSQADSFDAELLGDDLATRLENALVIHPGSDEKGALGIIHDASKTAAAHKVANWYADPAERKKLFAITDYPLASGTKKVPADAFLTGLVKVSDDTSRATVVIQFFSLQAPTMLEKIGEFEFATEAHPSYRGRHQALKVPPQTAALKAQEDARRSKAAEDARMKAAVDARKAEEARRAKAAEEARKAQEALKAKAAEVAHKAEDARRAKAAEEARKAKAEEARKKAQEEARKAKAAEDARKAEEARKAKAAEGARTKAAEEPRKKAAEDARKALRAKLQLPLTNASRKQWIDWWNRQQKATKGLALRDDDDSKGPPEPPSADASDMDWAGWNARMSDWVNDPRGRVTLPADESDARFSQTPTGTRVDFEPQGVPGQTPRPSGQAQADTPATNPAPDRPGAPGQAQKSPGQAQAEAVKKVAQDVSNKAQLVAQKSAELIKAKEQERKANFTRLQQRIESGRGSDALGELTDLWQKGNLSTEQFNRLKDLLSKKTQVQQATFTRLLQKIQSGPVRSDTLGEPLEQWRNGNLTTDQLNQLKDALSRRTQQQQTTGTPAGTTGPRPPATTGSIPPNTTGGRPPAAPGTLPVTTGTRPPATTGSTAPTTTGGRPPAVPGPTSPATTGGVPPTPPAGRPPATTGSIPPATTGGTPPAPAAGTPPATTGVRPPATTNTTVPPNPVPAPTPQAGVTGQVNDGKFTIDRSAIEHPFDSTAAIKHALREATAVTVGACSRKTSDWINTGLPPGSKKIFHKENEGPATGGGMGPVLKSVGFAELLTVEGPNFHTAVNGPKLREGDVVVIKTRYTPPRYAKDTKKEIFPPGHVALYTGKDNGWVSDFKQGKGSDPNVYPHRKDIQVTEYTVYRYQRFEPADKPKPKR